MAGNHIVNPGSGLRPNMRLLQGTPSVQTSQKPEQAQGGFDKLLQEKISEYSGVKFSKHAELRLQSRNIHLSSMQKEKINQAVKKAEAKGVKDTLVLMDNLAFVVNVKNKTVITAVNGNELQENVFTHIDGAVFA